MDGFEDLNLNAVNPNHTRLLYSQISTSIAVNELQQLVPAPRRFSYS